MVRLSFFLHRSQINRWNEIVVTFNHRYLIKLHLKTYSCRVEISAVHLNATLSTLKATLKINHYCVNHESLRDFKNNIGYCDYPWLLARSWKKFPISEDTVYFGYRIPNIWVGPDLKHSYLGTSFHGTRRCWVACQREKAINNPTSCDTYEEQQQSAWQDLPRDARVSIIYWWQPTDLQFYFKAILPRWKFCLVLETWPTTQDSWIHESYRKTYYLYSIRAAEFLTAFYIFTLIPKG